MTANKNQITLGIDLGDRRNAVCVLDNAGQIMAEESQPNTRGSLEQLSQRYPGARIAMETGTHCSARRPQAGTRSPHFPIRSGATPLGAAISALPRSISVDQPAVQVARPASHAHKADTPEKRALQVPVYRRVPSSGAAVTTIGRSVSPREPKPWSSGPGAPQDFTFTSTHAPPPGANWRCNVSAEDTSRVSAR
jgi:hypothetical protein